MIATENRLRSATFVEAYSHQNRSKRLLGHRKSIQPMAKRLVLADYDQLHHFIAAGILDAAPVETELLVQTDRLVGGSNAVLVIDDTAIPRKGTHSVGVAAQYASAVGCGLSQKWLWQRFDRVMAAGVRLGCVLADACYGLTRRSAKGSQLAN